MKIAVPTKNICSEKKYDDHVYSSASSSDAQNTVISSGYSSASSSDAQNTVISSGFTNQSNHSYISSSCGKVTESDIETKIKQLME